MGDDLGDEWWKQEDKSGGSEAEEEPEQQETGTTQETDKTKTKPEKRKRTSEKTVKAKKKKSNEQNKSVAPKKQTEDEESTKPKRKRKKKKKTITDVLAVTEPKPGCPADLQKVLTLYFSDKRSVIEQEALHLEDSDFLSSNDLTHSLSSYLKQVCPKWAKIQKQHTEKGSAVLLIVCSSALRCIELIKNLSAFKGQARVLKLFAKHIKVEEQVKLLQKGVVHIGVGTPGRISALIDKEALSLTALRYLVVDWNWRDQKLRRMVDIPEIKLDFMKLLESVILNNSKEGKAKIGLF
ncbi:protein CMSS1 [Betta splendens]|uniref:Protein CMSS1 n=1 Tax=Betta splendens TaxID=158456 RepID=A0A6P7LHI4_BETSP|nr:protein CMSS1 [Betta splendens]